MARELTDNSESSATNPTATLHATLSSDTGRKGATHSLLREPAGIETHVQASAPGDGDATVRMLGAGTGVRDTYFVKPSDEVLLISTSDLHVPFFSIVLPDLPAGAEMPMQTGSPGSRPGAATGDSADSEAQDWIRQQSSASRWKQQILIVDAGRNCTGIPIVVFRADGSRAATLKEDGGRLVLFAECRPTTSPDGACLLNWDWMEAGWCGGYGDPY